MGTPSELVEDDPYAMHPVPGQAPERPIVIIFDGGSKGNPGKGYGSYALRWPGQQERIVKLQFGDDVTNNEAEYDTLIAALEATPDAPERPGRRRRDGPGDSPWRFASGDQPGEGRVEVQREAHATAQRPGTRPARQIWPLGADPPRPQQQRSRARALAHNCTNSHTDRNAGFRPPSPQILGEALHSKAGAKPTVPPRLGTKGLPMPLAQSVV